MKRDLRIDVIRTLCILAVVAIHVTGKSLATSGYDILRIPWTFYFEIISRFAVPLFFIVSGYSLSLRYDQTMHVGSFYKKRLDKLLLPYISWSLIYMFLINQHHVSLALLINFLQKLVEGGAAIQLYFIPSIILLYIAFPLLRRIAPKISKRDFVIFSAVEFLLLSLDYFWQPILGFTPLRIAVLNLYLFVLGILTYEHRQIIMSYVKKRMRLLTLFVVLTATTLVYETRQLFLNTRNVGYIDSQWQPTVFTYTVLLWFWFLEVLNHNLVRFQRVILFFSEFSFFVFFVHIIYLSLFWRFIGSYLFSLTTGHIVDTFWFTPLAYIFVITASYASAYLVSFIPKIKRALGVS